MRNIYILLCSFLPLFFCNPNINAQGTPEDDGLCDPPSTIATLDPPADTFICRDGSNTPTLTPPASSLPDIQFVYEVTGGAILNTLSAGSTINPENLDVGDELCYYAFAYDLVAINDLLSTFTTLCAALDCDAVFGIQGLENAIDEIVNGTNDGVPGVNDLSEVILLLASFGTLVSSVQQAVVILNDLNTTIGQFGLGPVCFAISNSVCLTVEDCDNTCPNIIINDNNLPSLPPALCPYDALLLCFDIVVDEANFDPSPIQFGYEVTIDGTPATVNFTTSYSSGTAIDPTATGQLCFEGLIPAGNNPCDPYELTLEIIDAFYNDAGCPNGFIAYDLNITNPFPITVDGLNLNDLISILSSIGLNPLVTQISPITDPSCGGIAGCTDDTACNYNPNANCDDGLCDFGNTDCPDPCNEPNPDDGCDFTTDSFDAATCTVTNIPNCAADETFDAANCACITNGVPGCLDPCDPNYDMDATIDDPALCAGYDTTCNTDCLSGDLTIWDAASCSCILYVATVLGCTNSNADNYDPAANCDDGSCTTGPCEDEISGAVIVPASCAVSGVEVTIYDATGNTVTALTTDATGVYNSSPTAYPCGDYTAELTANIPTCYIDADGEIGPKPFTIDDDPNNNDADGADFMAEESPPCSISVEVSEIICDDNDTPQDGRDDMVTIIVTVNSTGPWTAGNGTMGNDGDTYTFPATAANNSVTMMFSVDGEVDCTTTFSLIVSACDGLNIPTLSQWGLIVLCLLMMSFGAIRISSSVSSPYKMSIKSPNKIILFNWQKS